MIYFNSVQLKGRRDSGPAGGKITADRILVTDKLRAPAGIEDAFSGYARLGWVSTWTPYEDGRFPRVDAIRKAWLPRTAVVRRTPDPAYYKLLELSVRLRNGFVTPICAYMHWRDFSAVAHPVVVFMALDLSEASPSWTLTESSYTVFDTYWDDYIYSGDTSPDPMPSDVPRQWQYKLFFRPQVSGVAAGELVDFKFGIFANLAAYNLTDFNNKARNLAIMAG